MLTAVLAGVALSRGYYEVGQGILIVVAGLAGIATQLAVWRLTRTVWSELAAGAIAVAAALSLALPLAF